MQVSLQEIPQTVKALYIIAESSTPQRIDTELGRISTGVLKLVKREPEFAGASFTIELGKLLIVRFFEQYLQLLQQRAELSVREHEKAISRSKLSIMESEVLISRIDEARENLRSIS